MTPRILIHSLAKKLREVLKDFKLEAEYQADKRIVVYEQIMPQTLANDDTFYPNVVVYLVQVDEDGTDSLALVDFSIGVYAGENEDGWQDLFNIAERIRQFVLTNLVIDEKFPLEMPMQFVPVPPAEQPEPFFFAHCFVRYRIATPRVSIPDLILHE